MRTPIVGTVGSNPTLSVSSLRGWDLLRNIPIISWGKYFHIGSGWALVPKFSLRLMLFVLMVWLSHCRFLLFSFFFICQKRETTFPSQRSRARLRAVENSFFIKGLCGGTQALGRRRPPLLCALFSTRTLPCNNGSGRPAASLSRVVLPGLITSIFGLWAKKETNIQEPLSPRG